MHDGPYESRAAILKAMAHPARLRILDLLADGELPVGSLHADVGGDLSTVSRHLAVMKAAGLLAARKQGTQVLYSLRVPCVMKFFGCVEAVLESDLERRREVVASLRKAAP